MNKKTAIPVIPPQWIKVFDYITQKTLNGVSSEVSTDKHIAFRDFRVFDYYSKNPKSES
jgi:hypothetical protein